MTTESDRELLELAAKAAGVELAWGGPDSDMARRKDTWDTWNPLADDGDALRLAVKCRITDLALIVGQYVVSDSYRASDDMCAIARRAITHAAAEIARATHKEGA